MAGSREAHDRFELPKPVGHKDWQRKACFHGTVTGVFLSLKRFTVADFRSKFRDCNPQEYGYSSFDNLFTVNGCVLDGNHYTYDHGSALQIKARLVAANLRVFSIAEFYHNFKEIFVAKKIYAKKFGFASVKDLLKSIPGLMSIGPQTFKVSDGIDLLSKWRNGVVNQKEIVQTVAAERKEKHALFKKNAIRLARKLRRFTKIDFVKHWKWTHNIFRNLPSKCFGFENHEDLIKSIPGVRSVLRTGEPIKFMFFESDVGKEGESEEPDDEDLSEEEHFNEYDKAKEYKEVLMVARTLSSPFTECELHDALAKYYNVCKPVLFRIDDRKVPVFLEMIPGIEYIHRGKYECKSASEKGEKAVDYVEIEESEGSSSDSDGSEKREEEKVVKKSRRSTTSKEIIEIGSSSSDDEDEATVKKDSIRSAKTSAKQQNGSKKKRESDGSKESSSDSEEEESSSSEDEASKFVKEVPAKMANKRSRGKPICISIDSSDDDEKPACRKKKRETSNKKENLSEEPGRATKKQMSSVEGGPEKEPGGSEGVCDHESMAEISTQPTAPSNKDILNNSFSSQSSTSTNHLATTNPLQMMPSMLQHGPTPYQQPHHFLMQQGIHGGGVPYMTPGHQPMPHFAPVPVPRQTSSPASIGNKSTPLIDLEADVKNEAVSSDDRSISDIFGRRNPAANSQLPLMNPGLQNFWVPQFPFGVPHPAPSMFHSGFAGGFGAPVLPGFGHPLPPQTMMHPQPQQLPHNIMDFLNAYMGSALPTALQQGASPLELAKKVLENVYGNQQMPPPQQ